jgi:hypothetical protein
MKAVGRANFSACGSVRFDEGLTLHKRTRRRSMRRTALFVLAASVSLMLLQTSASAGGWWTTVDLHDQYLGVGESLKIKVSEVLYGSIEEAKEAQGINYYAYLVKEFDRGLLERAMTRPDPDRWWRPLSPVINAGEVTLFEGDANLTRGRLHLLIPEIPPGRYSLMLCDADCRTPLGNHIPVPVNVTEDVLAAKTARRLDGTNERLRLALARVRRDVRQTQRQVRHVQNQANEEEGAATLPEKPASDADEGMPPWITYAGWFIAGAAAALSLTRRRRQTSSHPDLVIERIPDDARELTRTP